MLTQCWHLTGFAWLCCVCAACCFWFYFSVYKIAEILVSCIIFYSESSVCWRTIIFLPLCVGPAIAQILGCAVLCAVLCCAMIRCDVLCCHLLRLAGLGFGAMCGAGIYCAVL